MGIGSGNLRASLVSSSQILEWSVRAQRSMRIADETADKWAAKKPEIEEHQRDRLLKLNGMVEDFALRKALEESWTLTDLIKKHAWHRDEANRLHNAILAQAALREMLNWAERGENG